MVDRSYAILTPVSLFQLLLGWAAYGALAIFRDQLPEPLPIWALGMLLAGIILVIIICAFGVVAQAEHLARRLGDPYGTLVLTLSIVIIEVILIAAVMLGPGEQATIARDSVMAVSMIIMNLAAGLALVVAGAKHAKVRANPSGVSAYFAMIVGLLAVAFWLPKFIGDNGTFLPVQAIIIAVVTLGLYVWFLWRQMGPKYADFQELGLALVQRHQETSGITDVLKRHRKEISARSVLLVLTVLPVVLLSQDMATFLDQLLVRVGAPVALSGLLIAMIVFLPETITTIRAGLAGEIQRVSNLTHGALVSTVGLTIPAVLLIGLLTDQTVVLQESGFNLIILAVTVIVSLVSFWGRRVTIWHGIAHLVLFVIFAASLFQ